MAVGPVMVCGSSLARKIPHQVVDPDVVRMVHFDPTLPTYRTLTVNCVNLEKNDPTLNDCNARHVCVNSEPYKIPRFG